MVDDPIDAGIGWSAPGAFDLIVDEVAQALMHDDEVPTDAGLVRRLLAEQFPAWARLTVERVTSTGTDYAVYRLGADLAVRLPRIGWAVDQVHRDADWLPRIGPLLPVAVPEPVAVGEPVCGYPWPWAVHRWVPGANPVPGAVADPHGLAVDLAELVNALQRLDLPGGRAARRGLPLATQDEAARRAVAALGAEIDPSAVLDAWDEALTAPSWRRAAHLVPRRPVARQPALRRPTAPRRDRLRQLGRGRSRRGPHRGVEPAARLGPARIPRGGRRR